MDDAQLSRQCAEAMENQDVPLKDPHGASAPKETRGNSIGDGAEKDIYEGATVGKTASSGY